MSNPYLFTLATGVVCIGGGWLLYCLSPPGAAEREQTRRQAEERKRMYRKTESNWLISNTQNKQWALQFEGLYNLELYENVVVNIVEQN